MNSKALSASQVFDVGINERLPPAQMLLLGLQNVFGMTGMFVFPALLGHAFDLAAPQIAYVYGMTFIACGVCTILQSVWLLRLPVVQGPYAGCFGALMAIGHIHGAGLGAAYGSFFVAALIWCVLSVPIRGHSVVGLLARFLQAPIISGMMVMLIMIQISSVSLPNWIGQTASPGFPFINLLSGAVAVAAIVATMLWGGKRLRRGTILIGLGLGAACYTLFKPISFAAVAAAPLLVEPRLFPFGFIVRPELVVLFLLVLLPGGIGSMALYKTVADWGGERLGTGRMSEGVFGAAIGAVVAAVFGGFSTIVYPDNIGMLRATRVGSRYATLAAGVLLILLGACIKFDMLLVIVPSPVISAAATLLFGIVFMHGVAILANVEWDDRNLISAGLGFLVGLGGLFVTPEALQAMPLLARLVLQQPVISGGLTLVVLHTLLNIHRPAPAVSAE
ncbi:solute carrier family 23 protein [Caulobacter sp. S45]|uniref:solute carrier family 23 protein n=1 Tax=Caulobacter sp. S45 TaxID=1641861 RepID=UPI001C204EA6|nr:solute carrier family 23 protein [Caulobacter sp. S45]